MKVEIPCDEIARGPCANFTGELLASRAGSSKFDNSLYGSLRDPPLGLNDQLLECLELGRVRLSSLRARSVSSICDFQKITFRDLTAFFSFLLQENIVFFRHSY